MNIDKKNRIITIFLLIFICILSFIKLDTLKSPPIASDDWSLITAPYMFNEIRPYQLLNHRPLDMSFYYILTKIFGVHFEYFYLINTVILFLSAMLVYALTNIVFPQNAWFASIVAIIYLIYPVDYTRTWIIMLYIRFWWLVSLVAVWAMIGYAKSGEKWKYILFMAGIILPLGAYEGQFGFVGVATVLTTFLFTEISKKRQIVMLSSIITIGLLFYLWRFQIQARIPNIRYYSAGGFHFSPVIILERYWQGFKVFFQEWLNPIETLFDISRLHTVVWFLVYCIFFYFLVRVITQKFVPSHEFPLGQKISILKVHAASFIIGGVLWVAGYFPIIGLYSPSLNGYASRINLFAIAGAALAVVSLVTALAILLSTTIAQHQLITVGILLPLISAGIFSQSRLNIEKQFAWETQKNIWAATFDAIPNIQDGKIIVMVIPGYEHLRPFQSYPFTASWETDAATKVLYNNQNVGGLYFYKDLPTWQIEFRENGIIPPGSDRLLSYKRLLFILYNPQNNTATLVENLQDTLELPFTPKYYSPYENIAPLQQSTTKHRWLVQ